MIASQRYDAGVMLSVGRDRDKRFTGNRVISKGRKRVAVEEGLVSVLDLLDCVLVVVWRDGYVSTVYKFQPRKEWVDGERDIVAAVESQTT